MQIKNHQEKPDNRHFFKTSMKITILTLREPDDNVKILYAEGYITTSGEWTSSSFDQVKTEG